MIWLAVALGGTVGTLARHAVNLTFLRLGRPGALATATVNLLGSVVIGALAGALAGGRLAMSAPLRAFVFVGILGGFTTFSTFMLDTLTLGQSRSVGAAVANVALQTMLGAAATLVAYRVFAR
jgi:CrcB protein